METEFASDDLRQLENPEHDGGFGREIARAYRRRLNFIRAAADERDLRKVRGNRFEKLKGNRSHQHSLRLNAQWRLIVEITPGTPKNTIRIVGIEDYH